MKLHTLAVVALVAVGACSSPRPQLATGTAAPITKLSSPPRRSILVLTVTAEEQGLLGSQYCAEAPIYPLAKTTADINMDS